MKRIEVIVSDDHAKTIVPLISDYVDELHVTTIKTDKPIKASKSPTKDDRVITPANRSIGAVFKASLWPGNQPFSKADVEAQDLGLAKSSISSALSVAKQKGWIDHVGNDKYVITTSGLSVRGDFVNARTEPAT
jgi:hypothetical protein